jgi:serine/threonine-protein kinase
MKDAPMTERILNDRYALESKVGEGGMAVTYRARDLLLNRTVAIKLMREQFTSDPKFVERFRHEAQAAARLSNENIASVYDTGTADGTHYIVMEFVEGTDLKQRLRANGPLPLLTVLELGKQIANALEAAHEKHLVHRDIKPHNILLNGEGKVKVTDFGIAKVVSDSEDTGVIIGSVHYISPEQARGEATTTACDIYALGCVLFEMLTGRTVFEGENSKAVAHKQIYEQPPSLRSMRPDVPPALEALVLRCLEKEAKARYGSAAEVRAALTQLMQQLAQEETVVIPLPPASDSTIVYRKPLNNAPDKPYAPPATPAAREEVEPQRRSGAGGWMIAIVFVIMAAVVTYAAFSMLGNKPKQQDNNGSQPVATATKITVPDLSDKSEADVRKALQALKLRPDINYRYDQNIIAGIVCQQEPTAGTEIAENQVVHVWVSQGKMILEMPNVLQMTLDKAKQKIRLAAGDDPKKPKLNFTIKSIQAADVPAGQIAQTEPATGAQVDRKNDKITLFVSSGPGKSEPVTEVYDPGNAVDIGSPEVYVRIELENPEGSDPIVLDANTYKVGDKIPNQVFKRDPKATAIIRMYIGKDENSDLSQQEEQYFKPQ